MSNRALYRSGPYRNAASRPDAYQSAPAFARRPSEVEFLKQDQNLARRIYPAQGPAHYPIPLGTKPRQVPWMALIIVHLVFGGMLYLTGPLLFALMFG